MNNVRVADLNAAKILLYDIDEQTKVASLDWNGHSP